MLMKILTTGCCGFIGSNFIDYMCKQYPEYHFYNIDKIDYCSNTKNIAEHNNYTFIYGNVCDYDLIKYTLNEYSIDVVVHFAAQSHVDNSFGNSISFSQDNVLGTHTILEACREYNKINRFIPHRSYNVFFWSYFCNFRNTNGGNKRFKWFNKTIFLMRFI